MNPVQRPLAAALLCWPLLGFAATDYLKEVPQPGELPRGKTVYVDDGTCPQGEVKEVTGGSKEKGVSRTVRCVKRPN